MLRTQLHNLQLIQNYGNFQYNISWLCFYFSWCYFENIQGLIFREYNSSTNCDLDSDYRLDSVLCHHFYESNGPCLVVLQCTDHYTGALMNGFCTHNRNHQKENNPSSSCCWPKRNNHYHASSFKPPTALMMMTILGSFINCIDNIIKWIGLFVCLFVCLFVSTDNRGLVNPSSSCCWPKRNNRYHASSFKPPTALMMMTILGAFINCINNIIKWIGLFVCFSGQQTLQIEFCNTY